MATNNDDIRTPDRGPILAFHDIGKTKAISVTCVNRDLFERFLIFLGESGIKGTSISTCKNTNDLPLTFDDGLESFYLVAFPLLRKYHFSATVFVVTGFVGRQSEWDYYRRPHMNWKQIIELQREGIEFGSHTHSHRDLRKLSSDSLLAELSDSRKVLEDQLATTVRLVSYPFGRFNDRVTEAARQAGYQAGFSLARDGGPMAIPRHCLYAFDTPGSLARKLAGSKFEILKEKTINTFAEGTILYQRIFGRR